MNGIDRPDKPNWKPAPGSGKLARFERRLKARAQTAKDEKEAKAAEARRLKAIRFEAFLRDHRRCRAFGTPLLFETDNLKKLAHSHHIIHKSAGGSDELDNRCTLSPEAHKLHHDSLLEIEGDGNETLTMRLYKWEGGTRTLLRVWESQL